MRTNGQAARPRLKVSREQTSLPASRTAPGSPREDPGLLLTLLRSLSRIPIHLRYSGHMLKPFSAEGHCILLLFSNVFISSSRNAPFK